ncbi:unnamed protein product [Adineta steineri]|uniref:Uncharacterized protein n=1 Tax=Adineta steineri TaxID=433720 RepID=A0A816E950_9BILA|nr:unnamed protein product [Adineta steineri]CAF1644611.1 unnamed protein product [Adineta steineri]
MIHEELGRIPIELIVSSWGGTPIELWMPPQPLHDCEANSEYNRDKYTCTFSKLIQSWREIWHERTNTITHIQFPFGFVQVNFVYFILIHLRTKHDVAYRLSRSGLAIAYNRSIEFQGPILSNINVSSDRERIYITYTAVQDITFRNLNGFQICCQGEICATNDDAWLPLSISDKSHLTIILRIRNACTGKSIYGMKHYSPASAFFKVDIST